MDEQMMKQIKEGMISAANQMQDIYKQIPVIGGECFEIPLNGRSMNVVYYKCGREKAPLLIGLFGGGFIFGSNRTAGGLWKTIGKSFEHDVAVINYRMAPDYSWRESMMDVVDTAHYMRDHAEEYGIDPERISVMGSSAGATIAASASLYMNQSNEFQFKNQILMYPLLDFVTSPFEKPQGSMDPASVIFTYDFHCENPEERSLSLVSPLFASKKELEGLPNTIIVSAGHDSFREEDHKYARMLQEAGVSVADWECPDMPHAYFETAFDPINEDELRVLGEELLEKARNGENIEPAKETLQFLKDHLA